MTARAQNRWIKGFKVWASAPLFLLLCLFLPDPDARARREYPVETLTLTAATTPFSTVRQLPDSDWTAVSRHAKTPDSFGLLEVWYRIKIPAVEPRPQGHQLVAEVAAYFLRQVDFYLVRDGDLVSTYHTGIDRAAASTATLAALDLNYSFAFDHPPKTAQTLYVRAASQGALVAPLALRSEEAFNSFATARNIILGALYGISIGIFLYNIILFVSLRQMTYLYFIALQVSVNAFALLVNGVLAEIWPIIANRFELMLRLSCALVLGSCICCGLFARSFLNPGINRPSIDRRINLFRTVALALLVVTPVLPLATLVTAVNLLVVTSLVDMLRSTSMLGSGKSIYFFNMAICGLGSGAVVTVVSLSGLVPSSVVIDRMYILGLIWTGLFLSMAIAARVEDVDAVNQQVAASIKNKSPKNLLNPMLRQTYAEQYNASEMTVSIMFVDIVSFTQIADKSTPAVVLARLAKRLDSIAKIIDEFGGSVDRSLGDGVLCFFGYDRSKRSDDHALDALRAAEKIQQQSVASSTSEDVQADLDYGEIPLPVRIGIHTDKVTIGNLGNDQLLDFSMVGTGVNFANRLETACSPFKIMVSEETRHILLGLGVSSSQFEPIMIAIKHQIDLVQAYEFDPLRFEQEKLAHAMKNYMKQIGVTTRQKRFRHKDARPIHLDSRYGSFRIIDFSLRGFQVGSEAFLAQKAIIDVRIDTHDEGINQQLSDLMLRDLSVEVRWSRKGRGHFEHGLKVLGGSNEQWQLLLDILLSMTEGEHLGPTQPVNALGTA